MTWFIRGKKVTYGVYKGDGYIGNNDARDMVLLAEGLSFAEANRYKENTDYTVIVIPSFTVEVEENVM